MITFPKPGRIASVFSLIFLVLGGCAVLAAVAAPYIGLGLKEEFFLYRLAGWSRSDLFRMGIVSGLAGLALRLSNLTLLVKMWPGMADESMQDIHTGLRSWPMAMQWAWMDTKLKYRRSIIGPLWITITVGATILGMGVVFSTLWGMTLGDFLPYICTGMITWGLITNLINEGALVFIDSKNILTQINLPATTCVLRMVFKQFIIFLHNFLIFLLVVMVFGINLSLATPLVALGLLFYLVTGIWFGLLFGMICARFRDVPQVLTNLITLVFFITPVFWKPEMLGERIFISTYNPLWHFVEIVRQPLLGIYPSAANWGVVATVTILGIATTWLSYRHFFKRLKYWL